jgi:MOSC domain-containing protein YiiM
MSNTTETIITRKSGVAFKATGAVGYRAQVSADGTVRVWDSVAGHYTLAHDLSANQVSRLVAQAAKV